MILALDKYLHKNINILLYYNKKVKYFYVQ